MVSNDDIPFNVKQVNVSPIESLSSVMVTNPTHIYTIPAGKRWVIRGVEAYRWDSGGITIAVYDLAGKWIALDAATATNLKYQPYTGIALPAGWEIRITFNSVADIYADSNVLYEEEVEY